ncbi:MAG: ATP-binding protein [Paludibacteraceae bacterium]|nr:ATP-binding protein [Paludibacteraceae bacterium]
MILNIENLGAIKQAKIDLSKKLTLFCGKNSTGKTYAAYVLHAFLSERLPPYIFTKSIMPFYDLYQQIDEDGGSFTLEKKYVEKWVNLKCEYVRKNLGSIFGISDDTCDSLFKDFKLTAEISEQDFKRLISMTYSFVGGRYKVKKKEGSDKVNIKMLGVSIGEYRPGDNKWLFSIIFDSIIFSNTCRMLTVERNSIYTFKTELSLNRNELIDKIQNLTKPAKAIELLNASSRRYPATIRESLRIANDLENVQKYKSPFSEIADRIENDLLMGEVSTTPNGDVVFQASSMPKTKQLPFHMSSSIVKTMASLVIYLRHIAAKGDCLIIDEPEMNFHPDVQVLLAKIFSLLANKGLRVVVSTHSDYIVREFNNLIMANSVVRKGSAVSLDDMGYSTDMLLDYNDINVVYFDRKNTEVTANPLPVDEMGFSIESIDETINQQNEVAENLYAALIDDEE